MAQIRGIMDGDKLFGTRKGVLVMTLARLTMYAMTAMIIGVASPAAVAQSLDYDYF
jgi:hypothetical protein